MAQPRPSLTLILDIDERFDSEETRLEVGRCYTYVGTALVRTHKAEGDAEPENIMRMLVKLGTRKYLSREDEESEALWSTVIERWLYNQFHTVVNNMQIFNRRQREIGNDPLPFTGLKSSLKTALLLSVCVSIPLRACPRRQAKWFLRCAPRLLPAVWAKAFAVLALRPRNHSKNSVSKVSQTRQSVRRSDAALPKRLRLRPSRSVLPPSVGPRKASLNRLLLLRRKRRGRTRV